MSTEPDGPAAPEVPEEPLAPEVRSAAAPSDDPSRELTALTTVPVSALGQPLKDFLAAHGIVAFVADDETGLDATRAVEVMVPAKDFDAAKALLADFWADNDGPRDVM